MTKRENMSFWDALATTDRAFTKPITGKTYKGDSPNPTYVVRKLTEAFGPIGIKWGWTVVRSEVRYGRPHQIPTERTEEYDITGAVVIGRTVKYELIREEYHEVEIEFWLVDNDGKRNSFSSFGGTPMLYMSKKGDWVHDEDAAKKSLTDAYTKAASFLGACADIFLGLFDGKYQAPVDSGIGEPLSAPPSSSAKAPADRVTSDPWG